MPMDTNSCHCDGYQSVCYLSHYDIQHYFKSVLIMTKHSRFFQLDLTGRVVKILASCSELAVSNLGTRPAILTEVLRSILLSPSRQIPV
jgi:hypothetical protein